MTGRVLCFAAAAALVAGPGPAAAQQAGSVVVSGPGSYVLGYTTPVVAVPVGGPLTLVQLDVQRHDVVAYDSGDPTRSWCGRFDDPRTPAQEPCPIFASPLVGLGRTASVEGLDQITAGMSYRFYCSIHEATMQATLLAV